MVDKLNTQAAQEPNPIEELGEISAPVKEKPIVKDLDLEKSSAKISSDLALDQETRLREKLGVLKSTKTATEKQTKKSNSVKDYAATQHCPGSIHPPTVLDRAVTFLAGLIKKLVELFISAITPAPVTSAKVVVPEEKDDLDTSFAETGLDQFTSLRKKKRRRRGWWFRK